MLLLRAHVMNRVMSCLALSGLNAAVATAPDLILQHMRTSEIPNVAQLWETVSASGFHNLTSVTNFAYFMCLTLWKYSFAVGCGYERWLGLGKKRALLYGPRLETGPLINAWGDDRRSMARIGETVVAKSTAHCVQNGRPKREEKARTLCVEHSTSFQCSVNLCRH
jgi:hypothetical protein